MVVHGVPVVVITGGKVVLEDGKLHVTQGAGRFVPTPGNNPTIYDRVRQRERVSLDDWQQPYHLQSRKHNYRLLF